MQYFNVLKKSNQPINSNSVLILKDKQQQIIFNRLNEWGKWLMKIKWISLASKNCILINYFLHFYGLTKVVSWLCSWECKKRQFPLDMASFSVNLQILLNNDVLFNPNSKGGFLESDFLSKFVKLHHFEPKGNCTTVIT